MSYALYLPEEIRRAYARHDPDREDKLITALRAELAQPQDDPITCGHIKALLDARKDGCALYRAQYNVNLEENDNDEN